MLASDPVQLAGQICQLHEDKTRYYGDTWCRRGRLLSIWPHLMRKVDRLEVIFTGEYILDRSLSLIQTQLVDLLTYMIKYRLWVRQPDCGVSEQMEWFNGYVFDLADKDVPVNDVPRAIMDLVGTMNGQVDSVISSDSDPALGWLDDTILTIWGILRATL